MGFQLHRLELPLVTPAGALVADIVATRAHPPMSLLCEGKSGNNIEEEQARRYAVIDSLTLRRHTTAPDGPVVPIYACLESAVPRIQLGLQRAGVTASLIAIGERLRLLPVPGAEDLVFDVAAPPHPPPAFIVLDQDSPQEEYREVFIPAVVACAARGIERVTVRALCEEALPFWTHLPQREGGGRQQVAMRIQTRAGEVLEALGQSPEFRDFFEVERGPDVGPVVHILRSPADFAPQGETQGWQAIRRRAERNMRGRERAVPPGQLTFEDLAREEKVGSDD